MSMVDTPTGTPFPLLPTNERLQRLEWFRFLIAASMLVTMIAETALLFLVGWYNLAVWLGVIAVQGYSLHVMTKMVARERALAVENWTAQLKALSRGGSS